MSPNVILDPCANCRGSVIWVREFAYHEDPDDRRRGGWYVVTRGVKTGVFRDWYVLSRLLSSLPLTRYRNFVTPLVLGVSGATYKSCRTRLSALEAYEAAFDRGNLAVLK